MRYLNSSAIVVALTVIMAFFGGTQPALAQDAGQVTEINGCMEDLYGKKLGCTANDVRLSEATNVVITKPCEYPGDTATFTATFTTELTAQERHDIGIYFAVDGDPNGDGALTGTCSVSTLNYKMDPPWLDLDGTGDPFVNTNIESGIQDTCGDIDGTHNPLHPVITLTDVPCIDNNGDGFLDLNYCTSWRQPGANELCTGPLPESGLGSSGVVPGAPSKCKCDSIFVEVPVPPAKLKVTKTADPTEVKEPGDTVTFTVLIENTSLDPNNAVTLDTLDDDVYGNLLDSENANVSNNICPTLDGILITAGGSAQCTFDGFVPGNGVPGNAGGSQTDIVRASGLDQRDPPNRVSGSDDATVDIVDVLPAIDVTKDASPTAVLEGAGQLVTFTVVVYNKSSADQLELTSLTDSIYGDLNGQGNCATGGKIAIGGSYTCSFQAVVDGQAFTSQTDIVTAVGVDNEFLDDATTPDNKVSATDSATVTINDDEATIELIKTASSTSVNEPGANVLFTFVVKNLSSVDTVYITSLTDDKYGDLNGEGTCEVPSGDPPDGGIEIGPLGSYTCSATFFVGGGVGGVTNVATADGVDDDGQPVKDDDDATVNIVDVPPAASLTKTATEVLVTYAVKVCNESAAEALTVDSLIDDIYGDITALTETTCSVPQTLQPKGDADGLDCYSCTFKAVTTTSPTTDTVTGTVSDNEGASVTPSDSATVSFE